MKKKPEGGGVGSAQTRSYTFFLTIALGCAVFGFIGNDLKEGGAGYMRIAFGLNSNFWIWAYALGGLALCTGTAAGVAVSAYYKFTGLTYVEDRIGYAKSGGADIAFWSGELSLITMLALFIWVIPEGMFGYFRPICLLGLSYMMTRLVARLIAVKVFALLYGDPIVR